MSGKYTVEQVLAIVRKSTWDIEDKKILKSLSLINDDEIGNKEKTKQLRAVEEKTPFAVVYLDEEGKLKFLESSTTKSTETVGHVADIIFSPEALHKIIDGKKFSLDQEKIRLTLENYVKTIPKSAETYKEGEIQIKTFEGIELSVSSLLSAGTKVLDAILYLSYLDSAEHQFIFTIHNSKPSHLSSKTISENIDFGNKAVKAAFCLVYNQGGLPRKSSDSRILSKFIRETVFNNAKMETKDLCVHLSSADPSLFPASVFLKISLDNVPTEVSSRCKMSIAGNRAIRYAIFAQKFPKEMISAPTDATKMLEYVKKNEKLEKAKAIVNTLCTLGSNFDAQKRMHPLSPERPSRKNFTLQMTCAIVYALSTEGREMMRKLIDDQKIEAFKRDDSIYGKENSLGVIHFPVLSNPEADFSELSMEAVKAAYGLTT